MISLENLTKSYGYLKTLVNIQDLQGEVSSLRGKTEDPSFWGDRQSAEKVMEELNIKQQLFDNLSTIQENLELLAIIDLDSPDYGYLIEQTETLIQSLEIELQFGDDIDRYKAYLEIHCGAGGTESQDWADMLFRMYQRYCEETGLKVRLLDKQTADDVGIKSVILEVSGPYAYGMLKSENGVHRLVRISPFDSNKRRHTTFASVSVTPVFDIDSKIEIPAKDLRIDTYRSQGAGGQNVNKTESAVRITHIPTGLTCSCQTDRSQLVNKDIAMRNLISKILLLQKENSEKALAEIMEEKRSIEWGSQIRNYVFCPYTLVKDVRTGYEEGDVNKVMDGHLINFVKTYLSSLRRK